MTVLLTLQVISRYIFNYSLTWTEEISTICYVYIVYLGVASAVKHRKHLSIDFLIDRVPFKVKKIMLIASNVIFIGFSIIILFPLIKTVQSYGGFGGASSPILRIPKVISFGIIPICMVFTVIRLIQDIVKLFNEEEKEIGASKPTLDLDKFEQEWLNKDR